MRGPVIEHPPLLEPDPGRLGGEPVRRPGELLVPRLLALPGAPVVRALPVSPAPVHLDVPLTGLVGFDGYPVGTMVTLRSRRMYEFLDRLVTIALPRVRDFRGVSGRSFDSRGNYNMGIKEQIIFPEIEYDKVDAIRGMNISITTTAKTDEEARALLAAFRFPFRTERA